MLAHAEIADLILADPTLNMTILEKVPIGLMIFDELGCVIFANKKTEELFGYNSKVIIGASHPEICRKKPASFMRINPASVFL